MENMQSSPCSFCGTEMLVSDFFEYGGKMFALRYEDCQCEGAKAAREEERQKREAEEKRAAAEKWERALSKANIPKKFKDAKTTRIDLTEAVLSGGHGLYLYGTYGTGKTTMAAAIAVEALRRGMTALFISDQQIATKVRATYDGEGTEEGVFRELKRPDVLVIDDLGKINPTEWSVAMLYRVIEERDLGMKPCVITSNYTVDQLRRRLTVNGDCTTAEAIASRIHGTTDFVDFGGRDRRLA